MKKLFVFLFFICVTGFAGAQTGKWLITSTGGGDVNKYNVSVFNEARENFALRCIINTLYNFDICEWYVTLKNKCSAGSEFPWLANNGINTMHIKVICKELDSASDEGSGIYVISEYADFREFIKRSDGVVTFAFGVGGVGGIVNTYFKSKGLSAALGEFRPIYRLELVKKGRPYNKLDF